MGMGRTMKHICLDMQRLFAPDGPWPTPWLERVLPAVMHVVRAAPEQTIFTRFLTPNTADDAGGKWRAYYKKWEKLTRSRLEPQALDLVDDLYRFIPPAAVFDKYTYSAFADGRLHQILQAEKVNTLVLTGAETDVCVLATVLAAVDLGYGIVIVKDAICSSSDRSHDDLLDLYARRFSVQIDTVDAEQAARLLRGHP